MQRAATSWVSTSRAHLPTKSRIAGPDSLLACLQAKSLQFSPCRTHNSSMLWVAGQDGEPAAHCRDSLFAMRDAANLETLQAGLSVVGDPAVQAGSTTSHRRAFANLLKHELTCCGLAVAVGCSHLLHVKQGQVVGSGWAGRGQLGEQQDAHVPQLMLLQLPAALTRVTQVAAGELHRCAGMQLVLERADCAC